MTFDNFSKSVIDPSDVILVFVEEERTLYDFHDYIASRIDKGFSSKQIRNGKVHDICVNGDFIQCEVDIDV